MATPAPAAASVDAFACPQCSAPTTFDPGTSRLVCDHCGNAVPIVLPSDEIPTHDLFGKTEIAALRTSEISSGAREIVCNHCGAHAVVTRRAERCAFCDAPMVVEVDGGEATIPPGGVLPFVLDGKAAAQKFAGWLSGRWFAPSDLTRRSKRDRLDGVYLPFWTFDAASTTQYDGQRGTVHIETETYTDSEGKEQTRTVETVDWFPVTGTVTCSQTDVLVAGSPTLPEKLVGKLAPWELPKLRSFDPRFLAGFSAERYKIQPADGFTAAYPIIEAHIKSRICSAIGGDRQQIDSMNVEWNAVGFRHLLLPVWLSSFRYRDKVFHVTVNAATGEVAGERPWSWPKIALLVIVIAALIAGTIAFVQSRRHANSSAHATASQCDDIRARFAASLTQTGGREYDADCGCYDRSVVPTRAVCSVKKT